MENGVSSCGGRLVSPIIGRFCGYFTRGRSPLSKGNLTVSANARSGSKIEAAPSVATTAPACLSRALLSIMASSGGYSIFGQRPKDSLGPAARQPAGENKCARGDHNDDGGEHVDLRIDAQPHAG